MGGKKSGPKIGWCGLTMRGLAMAWLVHYGSYPNFFSHHIMLDRLDRELRFEQTALNLRAYRQELLASNIANADTPYFKAKDIDFKNALENVMANRGDNSIELSRTSPAHIAGQGTGLLESQLKYRTEYQGAVDGNTVNIDVERGAFAENSIHMEAMLTFIKGSLKDMQTAIQGQ